MGWPFTRRTHGNVPTEEIHATDPLHPTAQQRTQAHRARKVSETSLVNKEQPYISRIQRWGQSKFNEYINDPFHTLLNIPWYRFIGVFFAVYLVQYVAFAIVYFLQSDGCIFEKDSSFDRALWLSSRTASTLGYDKITPSPDCPGTNLTVMLQVICASLVNSFMLGLVFARFSAPFKRASTVRFSTVATIAPELGTPYWVLNCRVANLRKHQLLRPNLRLLLSIAHSTNPSDYRFMPLAVVDKSQQETAIELGFPAQVRHVIGPESPLYNLSLVELEASMMELLLFVDGMDAMTSRNLTARHAYGPFDLQLGTQFAPLYLEVRAGKTGLDFSQFDSTVSVQHTGARSPEDLRHHTFRRLSEQLGTAGEGAGMGPSVTTSMIEAAAATPIEASVAELPLSFMGEAGEIQMNEVFGGNVHGSGSHQHQQVHRRSSHHDAPMLR